MRRKQTEAAERYAARREREDAAPRLHDVAPELQSLSLEVEDCAGADGAALSRHVRRVVVENAAALFLIPCGEDRCDGGHDVTPGVLGALGRHEQSFDGSDACRGSAAGVPCERVVRYHGVAEYRT